MSLHQEMIFCIGIQILVLLYLLIQTKSDLKEKQVSVMFNNFTIIITSIMTMIMVLFTKIQIPWAEIVIIILLLEMISNPKMPKFCHIIGSGDAKAYFIIYITAIPFHAGELIILAFTMLCSTISFLIVSLILKRIKGERYAFFPYLTAGYLMVCILTDLATY